MNHADEAGDGMNCIPKILLVNGEHRIKFEALQNIKAGDELLFDYGKAFAEKHKLTKKKVDSKKGIVNGGQALSTPAGRKVAKGSPYTARRGGRGGGKGSM